MRRAAVLILLTAAQSLACDSAPDARLDHDALDDVRPVDAADGGDAAPPFIHAAGVNAMIASDGGLWPIYPTKGGPFVAFQRTGAKLAVTREDGGLVYETTVGDGELFGGFDVDDDGFPDFGLTRREATGEICGAIAMSNTSLELHAGANGKQLATTPREKDLCWTFGATTYPTTQWSSLGVMFGDETTTIALAAYYAKVASFGTWSGSAFSYDQLDYPSTAAFDAYPAAKTNVYGTGKHTDNPHVANGLLMKVVGEQRLVFFTSSRVVQYAVGPRSLAQLRVDHPFITAGRTDLVGRDYGLVARDPGDGGLLVLLSGTSMWTVYQDMVTAKMESDPWGQIERHVTVYDTAADALDDRFYSYAHDGGDANKYEGRVAYPDRPFLRAATGRSRIAYSVYAGGHWWLHVSQPGKTADAWTQRGVVLWDVRDLDGDGVDELVLSQVEAPSDPDVPGYYFPRWQTFLAHLSADGSKLVTTRTFDGAIPELVGAFRDARRTTSFGALYPSLTVSDRGKPKLVLRKADGTRLLVDP
ncbi:MAG: hypothetical protein ABI175_01450 [Polyangiales bacterium]